jgi:hypothetical protein
MKANSLDDASIMSAGIFPYELARVQYLTRAVIVMFIVGVAGALLAPIPIVGRLSIILLAVGAAVYKIACLDVPRIRNAGRSPWYLLLWVVPPINVLLMLYLFLAPPARDEDEAPEISFSHLAQKANQPPEQTPASGTSPAGDQPRTP